MGTAVKAKAGGAVRVVLTRTHQRPSSRESYPPAQPPHHYQAPKRSYVSYERSGCSMQPGSHTLYDFTSRSSPYRRQMLPLTIEQSLQMLSRRSLLSLRFSAGRCVRGNRKYSTEVNNHSTSSSPSSASSLPPGMGTKPFTAPPPFSHENHPAATTPSGSGTSSGNSTVSINAAGPPPPPPAPRTTTASIVPEPAPKLPPAKRKTIVRRLVAEPFGSFHKGYSAANHRRPYITQLCTAIVTYFLGDLAAQSIEYYYLPREITGAGAAAAATEGAKADGQSDKQSFYDPARALRAMVTGAITAIPLYHWYIYLGRNFNHRTSFKISIAYKILVSQLVFTPFFNAYFFGMQSLLSHVFRSPHYYQHHHHHAAAASGGAAGSSGNGSGSGSGNNGFGSLGAKFSEAWTHIKNTVPTSFVNSQKFWPLVTAINYTFLDPHLRPLFANTMAIGWQAYLCLLNQRATLVEEREEELEEKTAKDTEPHGLAAVHWMHAKQKDATAA
ncbi:hypothetical protein L228DRAFT_247225 [Xylona heveae TC161]|uniref:Uncharacterized protein n=1 Tax=Xylona heveae (strain CBS 132557 / TC161) TaxID=1328760 RepID=A0A165H0B8_XYLHT|nr:hypothetical protein L228DRAFT_247225 [Xylona heveae TC161]KZF22828.1 hypothetical protein L228DRAFT_247225 [Xylona heveae TC161]